MLYHGRIPLNDAEADAVEALLEDFEGNGSLTRELPGDTGPVLVMAGDRVWRVHDDGQVEEL